MQIEFRGVGIDINRFFVIDVAYAVAGFNFDRRKKRTNHTTFSRVIDENFNVCKNFFGIPDEFITAFLHFKEKPHDWKLSKIWFPLEVRSLKNARSTILRSHSMECSLHRAFNFTSFLLKLFLSWTVFLYTLHELKCSVIRNLWSVVFVSSTLNAMNMDIIMRTISWSVTVRESALCVRANSILTVLDTNHLNDNCTALWMHWEITNISQHAYLGTINRSSEIKFGFPSSLSKTHFNNPLQWESKRERKSEYYRGAIFKLSEPTLQCLRCLSQAIRALCWCT